MTHKSTTRKNLGHHAYFTGLDIPFYHYEIYKIHPYYLDRNINNPMLIKHLFM